jgi:hypothetical protein
MIGVGNPHRIGVRCDVNDFPSPGEVAALFPPGAVTVAVGAFPEQDANSSSPA